MKRAREAAYRDRMRREAMGILGNRCAWDSPECEGDLEIDHTMVPNWPAFADTRARWRRILLEARKGRLRLLCVHHLHLWVRHRKECA